MRVDALARATQEALHEREIAFAALAKVAPVGIMRFDANGRCNYVNDRWSQMTGMTIDQGIGDGWTKAIHPEDRPTVMHRWKQMRAGNGVFNEEYRLCKTDGSVRWVFAEDSPLRSYSGELLGFIRAVTDITRHRELEAELTDTRQALEERVRKRTADLEREIIERKKLEKQALEIKDNEQRRFSQDLHDGLGQHLTGILFRSLALQRLLEDEQSPHAQNASKIADLVNETINQAHGLARGVQPVPFRADGLIWALEELVKKLSDPDVVDCTFECDEPVSVDDNTVATHVYRIAQEAATNAIKHSKASLITVKIQALGDRCELSIHDDGDGISPDAAQANGRGMNIMKHRARLIDATIEIQSAPAQGTTVICRFRPSRAPQATDEKE